MYKFSFTVFFAVLLVFNGFSQKDTLSKRDRAALDSMIKNDQFLKLMNEKPKNSLDVSIGIGNGSFSAHNKVVNATGVTDQFIVTPGLVYRFKKGFSVGVTGYIAADSGKTELYQTGLTVAYDYVGKKVNAGATFTRYISDQNKYNSKSLYQNDFYAYIKKASGIIQPVLAIGLSNGKYKEIDKIIFLGVPRRDSTNNTSTYFYTSIGIEHDFSFYKIFKKGDELDFNPSLVINAGSDKTAAVHTNKAFSNPNRPLLNRRARVANSDKFQLQSVATSMECTYSVGKFFLQPNLYVDYYLPSTKAKRLSAIYSLTAGFSSRNYEF